jgi:N-acetylglucosamine kinase-like BadF-type ATPase
VIAGTARQASADALFVGVDGGGSKTLAVVVDAGSIERGRGQAGGSNYRAVGLEPAVRHVEEAIARALADAGGASQLAGAWLGIAGIDHPDDSRLLLDRLRTVAPSVRLTNDAELVLSGLPECVGIALIAGTGSIALGRNAAGHAARAGGWGHLLGDEGSGYDLGRRALQAAARAADGRGSSTALLPLILQEWGLRTPDELIERVHGESETAGIARLSSLVVRAAHEGDGVSAGIVRRAAAELALAAEAVAAALGFDESVPLALGGGLLLYEVALRDQVLRRLARRRSLPEVALVAEPALTTARALAAAWQGTERPIPTAADAR